MNTFSRSHHRLPALNLLFAVAALTLVPVQGNDVRIEVLSSRPDMVTGGGALVRIVAPEGAVLRGIRVTLNRTDVTSQFRADSGARTLTGLVRGLVIGSNTVDVTRGRARTTLALTNYPVTGPVFAGPKEQPYICETAQFALPWGDTLGPSLDANCSIGTRVDYAYRSTTAPGLKRLADPRTLPPDVALITTPSGNRVPHVVRVETGSINRAIYQIAVLHDPSREPAPSMSSQPGAWNRRLIYTFGGGCMGGWNRQGRNTGGVVDTIMLQRGYAVASSSLNVHGTNCDDVLASETMMMVKERFIEVFGPPQFTIGMGCSGGSYQQTLMADNYPGLLDGLIPGCSFPDQAFAPVPAITDGRLLNTYFKSRAAMPYTDDQRRAVTGVSNLVWMTMTDERHAGRITVGEFCAVPKEQQYDARTNPTGARCNIYDHGVNVYGRDPRTGFARRPLDNVGVQYGLGALNAGVITAEQFLDLNEKIGGFDQDGKIADRRSSADLDVIRVSYRSGRVLNGGNLGSIPIIDYRAYTDDVPTGDPHLRYHSFAARARLQKANGHVDNHVMLVEDRRYGGYSTRSPVLREALAGMDRWLTQLARDSSSSSRIDKLRRARPAELVDACWTRDAIAQRVVEQQQERAGRCNDLYPTSSFPRGVAGAAIHEDIIKCQQRPINPSDYRVPFTGDELARLQKIFPTGVCDWSKPGVEQQAPAGTWQRFDRPAT